MSITVCSEAASANVPGRTPYLWPKSDGPQYVIALASSAAFSVATALLAWVAKIIMMKRNKALRESNDYTGNFYVY